MFLRRVPYCQPKCWSGQVIYSYTVFGLLGLLEMKGLRGSENESGESNERIWKRHEIRFCRSLHLYYRFSGILFVPNSVINYVGYSLLDLRVTLSFTFSSFEGTPISLSLGHGVVMVSVARSVPLLLLPLALVPGKVCPRILTRVLCCPFPLVFWIPGSVPYRGGVGPRSLLPDQFFFGGEVLTCVRTGLLP